MGTCRYHEVDVNEFEVVPWGEGLNVKTVCVRPVSIKICQHNFVSSEHPTTSGLPVGTRILQPVGVDYRVNGAGIYHPIAPGT